MDKKLTDSEIVKACKDCLHYEACKGTYSSAKGEEDILYDFDGEMYASSGCEDFKDKDLINRLQANNEKLNTQKNVLAMCWKNSLKELRLFKTENKRLRAEKGSAKAEAYKELLNLLESRLVSKTKLTVMGYESAIIDIKNHLKEMVGDK